MKDPRYTGNQGAISRFIDRKLAAHYRRINETVPWHRQGPEGSWLEKWLGVLNLLGLRIDLREENLHDTDGDLTQPKPGCPFHSGADALKIRTPNGTQNDPNHGAMGCRGSRFGRNVPRTITAQDAAKLLKPDPLLISQRLMARQEFIPATTVNLLAAAWIQFQVHDWMLHENEPLDAGKDIRVPPSGDWLHGEMVVPRTKPDAVNPAIPNDAEYPAYQNKNPQWWDGSQIYGDTPEENRLLRTAPDGNLCPLGQLYVDPKTHLLPVNPATSMTLTGLTENWWLGLELLHTLFALEHNAICQTLAQNEKGLDDDQIYQKARLINCAVMAKIHTVEWTPGIIGHPSIQLALDANWMGIAGHLFGERFSRWLDLITPNWTGALKLLLTGIPGREVDHHGAPFALTEEFATVYRLHPLIPDSVSITQFKTQNRTDYSMHDISFERTRTPLTQRESFRDALYSFGVAHPGAITIRNYPKFLRDLELPPDPATGIRRKLDLAAVDIIRDRERGVPRYNDFLRHLRIKPVASWEELAGGDPILASDLKEVYEDDLEAVDTVVGMFCEAHPRQNGAKEVLPRGFGFSDTAFRVFILMASRRLSSDRFFCSDFKKETYTATGMTWIRERSMKRVILAHYPELAPALEGQENAFGPWKHV